MKNKKQIEILKWTTMSVLYFIVLIFGILSFVFSTIMILDDSMALCYKEYTIFFFAFWLFLGIFLFGFGIILFFESLERYNVEIKR